MNSRHRRTLVQIFAEPTAADLRWVEIEALLRALEADISEGAGSRVRVALGGVRAVFHRPHPSPETKRSSARAVRELLIVAGIRPGKD
jgi:HicA toxin of bacterial toxin-antitoxin,